MAKKKLVKVKVERWKSNENSKEVHFFINKSEYVIGFNPDIFPESVIVEILKIYGYTPS